MWHDFAAVWTCPRNVTVMKRLSFRISFPSTDTVAQTTASLWKSWSGELVLQHENSIKTVSVLSTIAMCILTWHGVALPHSPRTNLLTPCRAVSMQVLSYSSNSCSLDFKASKSRVKGETISYNEEKAICNRRMHSDVLQLLWYYIDKLLRLGYLMPVWNLYCCMDVKLSLSQTKFSVKYKPLWIDV